MTLYHVADAEGVPNIQEGLDRRPPLNRWAQYAEGFYLFGDLRDARQWQENRILFWRRHHVVLRFEIPDAEWQPLHVEFVSDENDWNLPDEWLTDYDVLEGRWGVYSRHPCNGRGMAIQVQHTLSGAAKRLVEGK